MVLGLTLAESRYLQQQALFKSPMTLCYDICTIKDNSSRYAIRERTVLWVYIKIFSDHVVMSRIY